MLGRKATVLRMRSKASKDDFVVRIGWAAKIYSKMSQRTKKQHLLFPSSLKGILNTLASKPLWFAACAFKLFHELLSRVQAIVIGNSCLDIFCDVFNSFTS